MIQWLTVSLVPQIAVAASLCVLSMVVAIRSAFASRRLHNLQSVERHMQAHLEALDRVMADDRVPLRLREKLLFFSEAIYDRDIFLDVLRSAFDENGGHWHGRDDRKDVLGELTGIDPALAAAYDKAVTSALMAMLFRYEEAGCLLEDHLAQVALDTQKRSIFLHAARRGQAKLSLDHPRVAAVA